MEQKRSSSVVPAVAKDNQLLHARERARAILSDIAYRMETVANIGGVEVINDSKATDVHTTYYSLELIDKPVIWLVGANHLEEELSPLYKLVRYKVKSMVCFGVKGDGFNELKNMEALVDHWSWYASLDVAVFKAWSLCRSGDAMILSPATPSFEDFQDFRQRGDRFNELIGKLK